MKTCNNIHSHIGILRKILFLVSISGSQGYRNPQLSSHSLIDRPNMCQNFPTKAVFSFQLGSESSGAGKSYLWCDTARSLHRTSISWCRQFCTLQPILLQKYRIQMPSLKSHIEILFSVFKGLRTPTEPACLDQPHRIPTHAPSTLDLDLHVSSGLDTQGSLGGVTGQTRVQSYFCCCRLLTGFPGWTLNLHTSCVVPSPTYPGVTLGSCSCLDLWNRHLLTPLQQQFHFHSSFPLIFLHIYIIADPAQN